MSYDLGTAHGKIELEYTGRKDVDRAEEDMRRLSEDSKDTDGSMKKLGSTLSKVFGAAGSVAKISAIGIGLIEAGAAAGNLVVQLLGMVPALTSILSLASAVPGAFVAIGVSVGVLQAAMVGVKDAAKAAFDTENPEKFNEALKKLSPSAQAAAKALQANVPALKGVQQGIQEAFFKSGNIRGVIIGAVGALKALQGQLNAVASDFGTLVLSLARVGLSSKGFTLVQEATARFHEALENVTPALTAVASGLLDVGHVGLPLMTTFGKVVTNVANQFAAWLSAIASDGRLQDWIDTALTTLGQLGGIAKNLGTVFLNVFKIAQASGGNLLATLENLTGRMAAFAQSAEGQEALSALFKGLAQVAGALTPVVTRLAGALASALGPAISQIAEGLGPVLLQVVQALTPAFAPLANAIADLVGAVAPLIPPIAQLTAILAGVLSTAVTALVNELGPLIALIGAGLSHALTAVTPLFDVFNQNLPLTAELGASLAASFAKLMPTLLELGNAIMTSLVPALPQLLEAAASLLPVMVELGDAFANTLNSGLKQLIPLIPTLVQAFVQLVVAVAAVERVVLGVITAWVKFAGVLFNVIGAVRTFSTTLISGVQGALTGAYNAIVGTGAAIIGWFAALPGRVIGAIAGFVTGFPKITQDTVNKAAFAVGAGIGTIVSFFANLPGRVVGAVSSLTSRLVGLVSSALASAQKAVNTGISRVVSFFGQLPGRARSAAASLPGQLASLASSAMNALRSRISSGISAAVSNIRTLPGRARSALGSLGGALVSAGRDLVMGLVRGIMGAIGAAVSAAVSVGRQVINGIKSTLKIGSPSKVAIEFGEWTSEGLAEGILNNIKMVRDAARGLANTVISPTLNLPGIPLKTLLTGSLPTKPATPDDTIVGGGSTRIYRIQIGEKQFSELVVDAITGEPVAVHKAASEGSRQGSWAGSGRK